jgi:hypothetical protein
VNGDFWSIFSNVELYRPRFIRVHYMNLDYAFWPTNTRSHQLSEQLEANIYPNPVRQEAILSLNLKIPGRLQIEILDMGGRILVSNPVEHLWQGDQEIKLEPGVLEPGSYLCRIHFNQSTLVIPFIKSTNF